MFRKYYVQRLTDIYMESKMFGAGRYNKLIRMRTDF